MNKCEMCKKDKEVGRYGNGGEFICDECIADDPERASGLLYFYQQSAAEDSMELDKIRGAFFLIQSVNPEMLCKALKSGSA